MYKLGIIGVGKMGRSFLEGILQAGVLTKAEVLLFGNSKNEGLLQEGYHVAQSEREVLQQSNIVLLAFKPLQFATVLAKLQGIDRENPDVIVVSMAAGVRIDTIRKQLGDVRYVRIMPNTPVVINRGMITIAIDRFGKQILSTELRELFHLLETLGTVVEIDETEMDTAIPLHGSMPAYLYSFARGFINNALKHGLDEGKAKTLVTAAIIGSAYMLQNSDRPLDELIADVCSKGGTTLAGLEVLQKSGFEGLIDAACDACIQRSKELYPHTE
ncbi:pyrroline-5-carboxylate reductase [Bacteroidia bacterium]|nr:pyrroline-5-carboxylate reductase [Bacteroidia bacterium]